MTALFYIGIFWVLAGSLALLMSFARYMGTRRDSWLPVKFWLRLGVLRYKKEAGSK